MRTVVVEPGSEGRLRWPVVEMQLGRTGGPRGLVFVGGWVGWSGMG